MTLTPEPQAPKKNDAWIWILVVAMVLCICSLLVGITLGGYFMIKQSGANLPIPLVGTLLSPTHLPPSFSLPTAVPPSAGGPIEVLPYTSSMDTWPALASLAAGYSDTTTPGTRTWPIQVASTDPAVLMVGWCTADQATLTQNYQHLTWSVTIDGMAFPISSLTQQDQPGQQGVCRDFAGGIKAWPEGEHTIQTTMHLDTGLNDGWNNYPAGDYTDVYQITVTP